MSRPSFVGVEHVPVGVQAVAIERGDGSGQIRRDGQCRRRALVRSRDHRAERALGAELDEVRGFGLHRFGCRVGEPHGRANVGGPVVRVHRFVVAEQPAAQGGEDRERGQFVGASAATAANSAVIGSMSCEWNACDTLSRRTVIARLFQGARGVFDRFRAPDSTTSFGAVHRGEVEWEAGHLAGSRPDREHAAAGGQLLHETAAGDDQPAGVVEAEHLGDGGRGVLADAVPEQPGRFGTEPKQCLCLRVLQREDRGLGELGAVDAFVVHDVADSRTEVRRHRRVDLVERVAEHRAALVQCRRHAGVLRALAAEQPARRHSRGGARLEVAPQCRDRLGAVSRDDRQPCLAGGLDPVRRPAQLRQRSVAVLDIAGQL